MFETVSTGDRLDRMEESMQRVVKQIRDELDDHLDTINQNTQELSSAYQYIADLENKVEKLSERVDELAYSGAAKELLGNMEINLSLREQEVFTCLNAHNGLSMQELTHMTGLRSATINLVIEQMSDKGVAISRLETGAYTVYGIDQYFKDLQARKQLITIHPSVSSQFTTINK